MIYSKNSLQVVQIVEPDKEIPAFNTVTFLQDGGIVAGNRKIFFWVSPLPVKVKKDIPIDEGKLTKDVTFWADSIKRVVKAIPKDAQFKGLLEHCDISLHNDDNYYATINDGSSNHKIELRESTEKLGGWKAVFETFAGNIIDYNKLESDEVFFVTMNRKRLTQMLNVLEKVIAYDGSYSPIQIYFSFDESILIRCKNEINDQRICIISKVQESDDYPLNDKEKALFYGDGPE